MTNKGVSDSSEFDDENNKTTPYIRGQKLQERGEAIK